MLRSWKEIQFVNLFSKRGYRYEEKESLFEELATQMENLPFCRTDGALKLPAVRAFRWLNCLGPYKESSTWTRTCASESKCTASGQHYVVLCRRQRGQQLPRVHHHVQSEHHGSHGDHDLPVSEFISTRLHSHSECFFP